MAHVLVIDDNRAQLSMRREVLRGAGFSVICASTAETALEIVKNRDTCSDLQLIVTDHVLPGASGAEFVRELRKLSSAIPVLVITGMDEAERDYAGMDVVFIPKPCAPEEFIAKARRAIDKTAN